MKTHKKWLAVLLAGLMLAASGSFAATAFADDAQAVPTPLTVSTGIGPQASYPGCDLGWACVWGGSDYSGGWAAANYPGPFTAWSTATAKTTHNSAGANGNLCDYARYYNWDSSKFFDLQSAHASGGLQSRDPNLANGAGFNGNASENWQNKVRFIGFYGLGCV